MKPIRLLGISASVLLLAGSARAQTTVFNPGVLRIQEWTDTNPNGASSPSKAQVEAGLAGLPTTDTTDLTILEVPQTSPNANNYTRRITGFFVPAVTTNYTFFICSDDNSDLFLSTDSSPANKRLIAQEPGWSAALLWVTDSGGGVDLTQKRSDKWSPDGGAHVPFTNGIPLTAGQKYWIEAVHNEAGGGDNVAVTFKFAGGADPADASESLLTGSLIGYGYTIPATLTATTQPTNATAYAGREATFTYVVSDPLPDPLSYIWYRNGTPVTTNIGGVQYTFLTSAADNNAQYQCVATLPLSYNSTLAITSSVANLTVNTGSIAYTNGLKIERFPNAFRFLTEAGNTGPASMISVSTEDGSANLNYTGAEAIPNDGVNNYGRRMSGWYIPPTSGNYVFFLSSDDDADLFLSTDNTPAKKTLIAQENVWSNSREWTNSSGASVLTQKRSDQWTNGLGDTPFSAGIALTAGTPYYIEANNHQGGGGDNLGVLAQLVGSVDPTNGAPPIPASQLSLLTSPTTNLSWATQPVAVTVFEGDLPLFTGKAVSDSEFNVLYQWQRSGTNIPGATTTSYTLTTIAADNGSTFDLIASAQEGGLSITSAPVTLTVNAKVFEPGLVLMQYYINQTDQTLGENLLLPPPNFQMAVPSFAAGLNNENGDNYVNSISGFFIPATTGAYDFFVCSDDHSDLFLSTDFNPNNKRMIAQENNWSNARQWVSSGGGSNLGLKRSDQWTNAASANLAPYGAGIQLTAGTRYYMEVWHAEGGGGDNIGVTYKKHGDPDPVDGSESALTGSLIGFNAVAATFANFTQQPSNVTVFSGTSATFSAGGVSDGKIPIGSSDTQFETSTTAGATNFVSLPFVLFQWYRNGTKISGATATSYTTPTLSPTDGAQYTVQIRALGIANWSTSTVATVTVITDTNKPTAYAATFDEAGLPVISVSFSKLMDLASISSQANYSVSGGGAVITGVIVDTNDLRHVQLQLAAEPTGPITLTLAAITDFTGNPLVTSTLSVATVELVNADIGDNLANLGQAGFIGFPGAMYSDGPGEYTVTCEGSDIWDVSDGFNFSYETKTNNFDVVVRQVSTRKVSNWSKGGLMAREDLLSTSRNWDVVNDPSSADGVGAIDGSGAGANAVECGSRPTNGLATLSWATTPTAAVPQYPNAWVRLKRTGQILQSYASSNGVDWVQQGLTDVSTNANGPLPANMYVGICCTAHANDSFTATSLQFLYQGSFADYNSSFIAPTNTTRAKLSASISGGNISISWTPTGGTLQSSPTVGPGATWTPVGTANPASVPVTGSDKFFRVGP